MSARIDAAILAVVAERGPDKSACPSDVARRLDPDDWRALMDPVRKAAAALARDGRIVVTQKGAPVDIETARGPVRLRIARG
ncbi:MAG: DUF3253 domain-containing protein [Pseudomonadota bacterium]